MKILEQIEKKHRDYKNLCEKLEKKLLPYLINSCLDFHVAVFSDEADCLMIVIDTGDCPLRYKLTKELIEEIIKYNRFPFEKYRLDGV